MTPHGAHFRVHSLMSQLGPLAGRHARDSVGSTENFTISKNLHRRHLTTSQRSMASGRLANLKKGRPQLNVPSGTFRNEDVAQALNVSARSVLRGRAVIDSGDDELIQQVETGDMSVSNAANI